MSTSIGELSLGIASVSAGDIVMTGDKLAVTEGCDNPQSLNVGGSNSPQSSMLDEGIASTVLWWWTCQPGEGLTILTAIRSLTFPPPPPRPRLSPFKKTTLTFPKKSRSCHKLLNLLILHFVDIFDADCLFGKGSFKLPSTCHFSVGTLHTDVLVYHAVFIVANKTCY